MSDRVLVAAALSLLAATVHAGLTPHHFQESALLGAGFGLAAAGQTAWTIAAVRGSGATWLPRSGLWLNGAVLLAYALSRTVGLPVGAGPWTAEPIGALDGLTAAAEVACGLLLVARAPRWAEGAGVATAAALICLLVSGMAVHG
jgi:hypothetical protein